MPPRPLYFMVKPPPDVAAVVAALPQAGRRGPELLHMTLLPLGDRSRLSLGLLGAVIAAGDAVRSAPFRLVFDTLVGNGRTAALRGSETIASAMAFQSLLA